MIRSDIDNLTQQEREILDDTFQRQVRERRLRGVLWSTLAAATTVGLFILLGFSVAWFAGIAFTLLVISAIEKYSYQKKMLTYESLITKLVHRIEKLEGVPLSPENARPSETSRAAKKVGAA